MNGFHPCQLYLLLLIDLTLFTFPQVVIVRIQRSEVHTENAKEGYSPSIVPKQAWLMRHLLHDTSIEKELEQNFFIQYMYWKK